jgi:aryl-alcohol dehydrogenase-like predicted oxidoreductase
VRYNTVGNSGLQVSALGLGCNNFGMRIDEKTAGEVVGAALDGGVTFFDTADIYGRGTSEQMLGRVLGARRDEVVLATKFGGRMAEGPYGAGSSYRHVMRSCEASLARLGTDHIDLYYQHFPDPLTPVEETLRALDDLVRQGKIRYAATSNLAAWQLADAVWTARDRGTVGFVASQVEWSLLSRAVEHEVVPAAQHFGLGLIPYFPLASGMLTGKYRRGEGFPENTRFGAIPYFAGIATDDNFAVVERLAEHGEKTGRTLTSLALSWLAAQPQVPSVLVGATSAQQITANIDALAHISAEEAAAITAAAEGSAAEGSAAGGAVG